MKLNVRFVERPLDERKLEEQQVAVQSANSLRHAEISETGLEMMTALLGKRLPLVLRADLPIALQQAINGEIQLGGVEGDGFGQLSGEILGTLFTCLERGGLTIFRLTMPERGGNRGRRAAFLLVDEKTNKVMLLEAKGHCSDRDAVARKPDALHICRSLRGMRNEGKRHLKSPPSDLLARSRDRVESSLSSSFPISSVEESVVATVVPDGRLASAGFEIPRPAAACAKPCTSCLHQPTNTLITVLSSARLDDNELSPSAREFLQWYKASERAIWGHADGSFGHLFSSLLSAWSNLDLPPEQRSLSVPSISAMVGEAVYQRVFVDFKRIGASLQKIKAPNNLTEALKQLEDFQGLMPRPTIREGSTQELGRILFGSDGKEVSGERLSRNWWVSAGRGSNQTQAELYVAPARGNTLEVTLVPRQQTGPGSIDDLCWGLAELLAGDQLPVSSVYNLFTEEKARWSNGHAGAAQRYRLGKSIRDFRWWPLPFWMGNDSMLQSMRNCCPACRELACLIESWKNLPNALNWHTFWEHRLQRPRVEAWPHSLSPFRAFVTEDARAVLRVPWFSPKSFQS